MHTFTLTTTERRPAMLNELVLQLSDLAAKLFPLDCMEPEFMRRAMLGLLLIARSPRCPACRS